MRDQIKQARESRDLLARCWDEPVTGSALKERVPSDCELTYQHSKEVKQQGDLFERCVDLAEANVKDMTERAWGWNRSRTARDMGHPSSRFLICLRGSTELLGFVCLRFDNKDLQNEEDRPWGTYIYELQVKETARNSGLGSVLLDTIVSISQLVNANCVRLTCFKENTKALRFYQRHGFEVDEELPKCYVLRKTFDDISSIEVSDPSKPSNSSDSTPSK